MYLLLAGTTNTGSGEFEFTTNLQLVLAPLPNVHIRELERIRHRYYALKRPVPSVVLVINSPVGEYLQGWLLKAVLIKRGLQGVHSGL